MKSPAYYALKAFETAATSGSFTKAADVLCITQSAVSKHIKALEDDLGCVLFERKGPKLELTHTGRLLSEELKIAFRMIENACELYRDNGGDLRLKAPSTLTMRWLLETLQKYRQKPDAFPVQLSSVWMDIDHVDLYKEPYDCAILLANGKFSDDIQSVELFPEWLIPICSPAYQPCDELDIAQWLQHAEVIHPSPDKRDWRRWLKATEHDDLVSQALEKGQIFDTLEQGNIAAIKGHGVSVGDLIMVSDEIERGYLTLPFPKAISTGDSYYLIWLKSHIKNKEISKLAEYLKQTIPTLYKKDITFIKNI